MSHYLDPDMVLDRETFAEAAAAWGKHTDDKWVPGNRVSHYAAWEAAVTALVAYQKHLDSVASAKTTTRLMMLPAPEPVAEIHFGVANAWYTNWPVMLRKGDRLIVSRLDNGMVTVDLERPCGVSSTPADRDFFVSG